jgi:hypothetical protein
MQSSYIKVLLLFSVIGILLGAAANFLVDPYGIYRWLVVKGFNQQKPKAGLHGQLVKPYRVIETGPKTLILGNSRVEGAIDPQSLLWPEAVRPAFNMALPATSIDVSLRSLQHVIQTARPSQVLIGIDFFDFLVDSGTLASNRSAAVRDVSDFEKRLLVTADGSRNETRYVQVVKDHVAALFSFNALIDSLQTVTTQRLADQSNLTALGFNPMDEFRRFVRVDGHHLLFKQVETTYLTSYLRLRPAIDFESRSATAELNQFQALIALCRSANIRLVVYIHPYHAHMLESYRIAGFWPLFEAWKRALVKILSADASKHSGSIPYALWDFSGYSDITTERVPAASELGKSMRWYWEAGHYRREVGERIISRTMLGGESSGVTGGQFGVLLTERNIEDHLSSIRDGQQRYALTHAEEIAALESLAQTVRRRLKGQDKGKGAAP